jgi:uncharacterized protein YbaP (TraB family)
VVQKTLHQKQINLLFYSLYVSKNVKIMKKKKQSLLWKISKDKHQQPSYVFGTMHVQDQRVFNILDQLTLIIADCDAFATEFNLDEADPVKAAEASTLPDGQLLTDILSKKQLKQTARLLHKNFGIPIENFYQQKPITLSNFLTMMVFQQEQSLSLDETLFSLAKEKGKHLVGLETFEDQLTVMKNMKMKMQIQQLMVIVKDYKKFKKSINNLTHHYVEGHIHHLYKLSKKGMGKLKKPLLYDRNITMADEFDKIAQEQTLFCAIGAGHLSGKKGVLKLLKDKGYKVKAV